MNLDKQENKNLDPKDWEGMRKLGHKMIDDVFDYLQSIKEQPVWKPFPQESKDYLNKDIPTEPQDIEKIYEEFKEHILPFTKGNIHPRFWAWVQGTGTPFGVLADMLASAMNPNVTIGEHSAMYVDKQVIEWCKQMMNYPKNSSGILVSGGSIANITALIVARNHMAEIDLRKNGLKNTPREMVLYCSSETHSCVQKAAEIMGLGSNAVRKISVDGKFQIDTDEIVYEIEKDLNGGFYPFCIIGCAGTVNTGAIDDLDELLKIGKKYNLWLHIDGAFGALAKLTTNYSPKLKAIEEADSVAFDLHKWMYMPYEVGCTLIKNSEAHRSAFAITPNYLLSHERGLASGPESLNNYGMELSRGFKALKVWMSLKEHGIKKYAEMIEQNISQAAYLGKMVEENENLELLTPVTLNIVCFRYFSPNLADSDLNLINKEITMSLQEHGIASPSSTILNGKYAIRVAITNQRSRFEDFEILVNETVKIGNQLLNLYNINNSNREVK